MVYIVVNFYRERKKKGKKEWGRMIMEVNHKKYQPGDIDEKEFIPWKGG